MKVSFPGGKRVDVDLGGFTLRTDQPRDAGGEGTAADPFSLFLASLAAWAASSWGRYWGWDPKEVWSLVAFLAYLGILHARWDKLLGKFGVAAMSIVAFQSILMTYLGVNFVLTSGMHSYATGDSPVVTWIITVAVAEVVFLGWGLLAQRRQPAALRAATA